MYYITEARGTVGSVISRDNGRLSINRKGDTTPASDEAKQFDSRADAEAFAAEQGLDVSGEGHWMIEESE